MISLSEVAAVHLENQPAYLERLNISPVIVITAGLDGDLSLAEARFLCERLVTDRNPELEGKRESLALAPADAACKGPGPVRRRPRPGWWPVACSRPIANDQAHLSRRRRELEPRERLMPPRSRPAVTMK